MLHLFITIKFSVFSSVSLSKWGFFCICMLYLCKMGHLSRLNANEMLIHLNDLLYLRHEKAQKLKCLPASVLREGTVIEVNVFQQ